MAVNHTVRAAVVDIGHQPGGSRKGSQVNHTVRAAVVDIRQDTPKREDAFLVDTNVWYWLTYGAASLTPSARNQVRDYPPFIKKAISAKSQLRCCGLSLSELASH